VVEREREREEALARELKALRDKLDDLT